MRTSHHLLLLDGRHIDPRVARELLLEEYRTLRHESVQRISSRTQLVSVAVAAAALLAAQGRAPLWLVALALLFMIATVLYYVTSRADARRIARHLASVEERLNVLARRTGSEASSSPAGIDLMSWSTSIVARRDRLKAQGWRGRIKSLVWR